MNHGFDPFARENVKTGGCERATTNLEVCPPKPRLDIGLWSHLAHPAHPEASGRPFGGRLLRSPQEDTPERGRIHPHTADDRCIGRSWRGDELSTNCGEADRPLDQGPMVFERTGGHHFTH